MRRHIVQSPEWAEFKTKYGTPAVSTGNVIYTKHAIPFTANYFAYCPKVDPMEIDFDALKKSLIEQDCVSVNFDVPNVLNLSSEEEKALVVFGNHGCVRSPRSQFALSTILMDLSKPIETLLADMHPKHRYNCNYAIRKGVEIRRATNDQDFDEFYFLLEYTAGKQKYFIRPKEYYKSLWDLFRPKGMAEIITAYYNGKALASWMFLIYDNVLYYPYGGSSDHDKNVHASNLVAWEGIKLGKERGCEIFDMWGASDNLEDNSDPWWGFTNFKLKFGGQYVKYMDSYDLVLNIPIYRMFNFANSVRWKLLKMMV